ncbi:hypothetical protein HY413_02525 [Candidatus Kaiserbacteria bacterium]|nr:hypothetical protein [Candidatus Kaiserbacteria bacterium]
MKTEHFADALMGMTARGTTAKEAVHTLMSYLEARGMKNALSTLPALLERKAMRERRRNEVVMDVVHHHNAPHAKKEAAQYLVPLGVDPHDVHIRENDDLIGGWRLTGKGVLVDNSFKKHLLSLYRRIII